MKKLFNETTYAVAYRALQAGEALLFETHGETAFKLSANTWRYWYADPIVFSYRGEDWLFVEQMNRLKHRGYIAVAKVENGTIGPFQTVLKEKFHLSYPMVFEKGGHIYMVPESTAGNCVNLYECKHFPNVWEWKTTLFENVLYADSTIVFCDEHWYFVTGEMDSELGAKTKTLVFLADEIESGILMPLESNKSSDFSFEQRGAGGFFEHNGKLYRPIQCGDATHYGRELKFIQALPQSILQEKEVARVGIEQISVNSKKTTCGIHSYTKTNEMEIIDIQTQGFTNLPVFIGKILRRIRRK